MFRTSKGMQLAAILLCTVAIASMGLLTSRAADKDSQSARDAKLPSPVLDTHHLMELFNGQWYMLVSKEMKKQEPSDEETWNTLHDRGLQAAELTNLIAIREIADKHRGAWMKHTRTARHAALQFADAAEQQNWERTKSTYQALIQNCNDCHNDIAPDHAPQLEL